MIRSMAKGLRAALVADATLTALVSTRVYNTQGPTETPLPYVIFSVAAGGNTNMSPVDDLDVMWTVKGIALTADTATQIADAILNALHRAALTLEAPWAAYDCQHEASFYYTSNEDRITYHHAGGNYRVRAFRQSS